MTRSFPGANECILGLILLLFPVAGKGQLERNDPDASQPSNGTYCEKSSGRMLCLNTGKPSPLSATECTSKSVPVLPPSPVSDTQSEQPHPVVAIEHGSVLTRSVETAQPPSPGEVVVALQINSHAEGDFVTMYRDALGRWYATADVLLEARLQRPTWQALRVGGTEYYLLDAYSGVSYQFDSAQQMLAITIAASNFQRLNLQASNRVPVTPMPSDPGFFLNHDLHVAGSAAQAHVSGIEEIGFFSKLGVLTSQFAAQDLTSHLQATRLQTRFFRDFPEKMATIGIGDSYSASFAPWGQVVNYAGIRWASNFTTQPAFLPFALPSIAGQAAQPSTVDLYVNSLKTLQQSVDEGPFTISNIPVLGAQGNIQMVVTDLLGRQQLVSLPYISSPQLVRRGVSEYAYESGVQRRNFGLDSNDYGPWFASATYRHGLSDTFTLGLRGEVLRTSQTLGISFDRGFLRLGVVSGGVAVSRDEAGRTAGLTYAQLQRSARTLGFSLNVQAAQDGFRQLGLLPTQRPTRFLGQAQVSYALGRGITVSAAYMHQEKPSNTIFDAYGHPVQRVNTVTPALNIRLPHNATLTVSGNYTPEFKQPASGIIMLIIPLQKRRMMTASTGYQAGQTSPAVEFSQSLPAGNGWGYRLQTSSSNNLELPRVDAGVSYQNGLGAYQLEASQQKGVPMSWQFDYTGGAVLLHGHALLSRQLTDSFAVVDTNGAPGVKVLANNNYIAKTDGRGLAIVPWLPAYNRNSISLDDTSVPLNLEVDLSEKTVVPMARSGLLVKFKAEPVKSALLVLVTEDGKEVPVGAEATVNGNKEAYEVAFHGEAYIPQIQFPASIRVRWDAVTCNATVTAPESKEPLPRIGPVPCRRVQ